MDKIKRPGGRNSKGRNYYRSDLLLETWMAIKRYNEGSGVMPTYRILAVEFSTCISVIQHRVRAMEREGLLRRIPKAARGFVLLRLPKRYKILSQTRKESQ